MSGTALLPAPNILEATATNVSTTHPRIRLQSRVFPPRFDKAFQDVETPKCKHRPVSLSLASLPRRRCSTEEKHPSMDSAVRRMSSFAFLPVLAVVLAANSVVGFIAPSVHVAPSHVSPSAWQGVRHATCRSRCRVRSESGLRWRSQSTGLSMIDPHVLRLQAAELGSRLKGTNLFFVGMMGTGKSTVARRLADVMGRYIFLDTDSIIEELLGASVGEVFATDGEEAFRSVESQVLDQVHSYVKTCIATGGGIVTEARNWGRMQTGVVVWLDMETTDILERLTQDPEQVAKRPLLAGDDPQASLDALMEKRRSQYAQADVTVKLEVGDDVDEVTLNVVNSVLEFIDSNPPKWQQWKEKAREAGIEWA